jgi:hypothetical protein
LVELIVLLGVVAEGGEQQDIVELAVGEVEGGGDAVAPAVAVIE